MASARKRGMYEFTVRIEEGNGDGGKQGREKHVRGWEMGEEWGGGDGGV